MIEEEIQEIKKRNKKVEKDKAWETSFTRKFFIAIVTYIIAGLFLQTIGVNGPWINAAVPTGGFVLSTLTLPILKKIWEKYLY